MVPRKKLELKSDAVPSIFPNVPKYLTRDNPVHRKDPEERRNAHIEYQNQKYSQWLLDDKILNVDHILNNKSKYNHSDWMIKNNKDKLYFMKIDFNECPSLSRVLVIDKDLHVSIIADSINIEARQFYWILGSKLICDTYSKLENLLTAVNNLEGKDVSIKEKINHIQGIIKECSEHCDESRMKVGLNFINEQLKLLISSQLRYSVDTLVFACSFFYSFPAAYRFLRDMEIIVLPHPSYLKTYNLSNINSDVNGPLKKYLQIKCDSLEPHEKLVCLLLDEIYVKPRLTYKGNKVVGMAKNSVDLTSATTVQTFMMKSLLSKQKDVVALIPVKNLDANFLHQLTLKILNVLHETGYEVVAIISDNARVNVKCLKLLCNDSVIHPYIVNPCDDQKKCFLLFDTVHLLKNLRNNWLNEKDSTFIYPSMSDSTVQQSKFQDVRKIYQGQKLNLVKHAPGLSYRVCYPNSFERQNVSYVVALFDDKTIAAMSTIQGSEGTKEWLQIIKNWWTIVNVKHPKKGTHLRDNYAEPIRNMEQENIQYLYSFCSWLKRWNDIVIMDAPKNCGKLSKETFSALLHTTETLLQLCMYLLNDLKLHYVLLGAFQTDDLEQRFGKYRQMSGSNYNVSVQQIIESERKLKVTNILKLACRQAGNLNVSEMLSDINAASEQDISDELLWSTEYEDVINDSEDIEVDSSTLEVIIFLAGYVSFKVSMKCECSICKTTLITNSDLICELHPEVRYLKHLNRGGLKYPSSVSIEIGTQVYKIFQLLVSDRYNTLFLHSKSPKSLTKTLVLEAMKPTYSDIKCECGKKLTELAEQCINIWVNIFLNNYTKIQTNVCVEESATKRSQKDWPTAGTSGKRTRKAAIFMDI